MCFAFVIFFALMIPLVGCFRFIAHNGAWALKFAFIHIIFFASCWLDDSAMGGFASFCLFGSAIFIAAQVLALLDCVYVWNEYWRGLAEQDESYFQNLLWCTIGGYVLSIVFIVLSIVQFAAHGCTLAAWEVSLTVIVCFIFSLLSVCGIAEHGSLLCSSMVTLYCTFYCWSALSGMDIHVLDDSGASCNTLLSDSGNSGTPVNVIVGLFLTCAGLAWAAFSATGSAMGGNTGKTGNTYAELSSAENGEAGGDWDFGDADMIKPLMMYHVIMVLCTMFMCMTVVNWQAGDDYGAATTLVDYGTGETVVVVKLIAQWFTTVLYIWTIVGQRCMAACGIERDFNF